MNRGGITAAPQLAVSYSNPEMFQRPSGGMTGNSALALFAAAALAGLAVAPPPLPRGLFPTPVAILAGGIL